MAIKSPQANYPLMIGGIGVSLTREHSGSLVVLNKRQSTVSEKIGNTQKFDISVDGKLANDEDSTSIFSKVIGREISHSSSTDLYFRYWMDFASDVIRTEAPNFVDLGLPDVNTWDEFNTFGTSATRIRRTTDGPHWYALDHIFGKAISVGMSVTRSKLNYSYKTGFQNWRESQDFGLQTFQWDDHLWNRLLL